MYGGEAGQTHGVGDARSNIKLLIPNWNSGNCQQIPIHTE